MKILLVEPFYAGSHKTWCDDYIRFSRHEVRLLSLEGNFWKWRMHGAAITLAEQANASDFVPDVVIASDFLDLSLFKNLTNKYFKNTQYVIYFHENQLAYPKSSLDTDVIEKRDNHYGFINYTSALVADDCFYNSQYNMTSFLEGLKAMLGRFPDHQNLNTIDAIREKSKVLHLGLDLSSIQNKRSSNNEIPVLLWNHRWEYDKNPELFLKGLDHLRERNIPFQLVLLGEASGTSRKVFDTIVKRYGSCIIHQGYVKSKEAYYELLCATDILPVTSNQDFFGISIAEAFYCGVLPVLPTHLSYPELFKEGTVFYEPGQFCFVLEEVILRFNEIEHHPAALDYLDWKNYKAKEYDDLFQSIVN